MNAKFIEGAKTLRYFLVFAALCVVGFVIYSVTHTTAEQKVSLNIEKIRLAACQEIVVAKATCNVKAEISENQKIAGFTMPNFMPGSKSVSYNGPVVMRFGYDSTMPLFPVGTDIFEKDGKYMVVIPHVPKPKVLSDPAARGYAKESTSYFTGDIPSEVFFNYIDSLALVGGDRTIVANSEYFRNAYAAMVLQIVKPLFGNHDFKVTIGDLPVTEPMSTSGTQPNFVEDIEGIKKL